VESEGILGGVGVGIFLPTTDDSRGGAETSCRFTVINAY
jgi:hypothetical protein